MDKSNIDDLIELSSDSDDTVKMDENEDNEALSTQKPNYDPPDYDYDFHWDDYDYPGIDSVIFDDDKVDLEKDKSSKSAEENNGYSSDDALPYSKERDSQYEIENDISTHNPDGDFKIQLDDSPKVKKRRKKLTDEEKEAAKKLKQQQKVEKQLERERLKLKKKAELQKQKALKTAMLEKQRSIKPEESIKHLKVHIDNEIINAVYGGHIITVLQQAEVQYSVDPQITQYIIRWSKKIKEIRTTDTGESIPEDLVKEEDEILYIVDWKKMLELVKRSELMSHIEMIKSVFSNKQLTLIIFGLEKYFNYQKIKATRELKSKVSESKLTKLSKTEAEYENAGLVTKDELESSLVELQLLAKCNHRFIETAEELSALVLQYTKSLAQLTYKQEKRKRDEENLDWFAKGDSKQGVKVDKSGNGLLNLWQQQICQFNNVGLEIAQAIASHYSSPNVLLEAYQQCDKFDGELLLQNIPVRRNAGILSSVRRVGPELSKKMYKFFMSDDPDLEL